MGGFVKFVQEFFPRLNGDQRSIALEIYRGLSNHGKMSMAALREQTALSDSTIERVVSSWPAVYRDAAGDVVGFWGLTAQPVSKHVLRINGQFRYAWCAWDCLFLPRLLGQPVQVSSECPQTGEPIELFISSNSVEQVQPDSTVLSLLLPDVESCRQDVVSNFCHFVYFFKDGEAARQWTTTRSGTHVISIEQGLELGRIKNEWQFCEVP